MRMINRFALVGLAALALAGCGETRSERTLSGAALGAAAGAAIGGAASGSAEGAVAGAAIGGVTGAIIGRVSDRPGYCYARNRYGERIVVRCPDRW